MTALSQVARRRVCPPRRRCDKHANADAPLKWRKPIDAPTVTAERRVWQSRCGQYRVARYRSNYGLPTIFYALKLVSLQNRPAGFWSIVSRHRKRGPALKACQRDARLVATITPPGKAKPTLIADWLKDDAPPPPPKIEAKPRRPARKPKAPAADAPATEESSR